MDVSVLQNLIEDDISSGKTPSIVIAYAGNSDLFGFRYVQRKTDATRVSLFGLLPSVRFMTDSSASCFRLLHQCIFLQSAGAICITTS